MSYGTSLGITLPTVASTAGPTWATNLNAAIQDIIDVLETKVTPSGMDINADLSFRSGSTSYRAKDVKAVSFTNNAAVLSAATYPTALFTSDSDGELYYNDNAGRQIALTDDGSVNVSTSGGITGAGYGSGGVAWNWDSGSNTFIGYLNSATPTYASAYIDDLKLNDGDSNTLTIAAPALAANYTIELPDAVAGTNTILAASTTASTTTLSFSATPTLTSLTTTGALSVGTTSAFTGKATFSVEVAHPVRTRHISPMECQSISGCVFTETGGGNPDSPAYVAASSGDVLYIPLRLEEGETLTQVIVWTTTSATAYTREIDIGYWNDTVGAGTYSGSSFDETFATGGGRQAITINNNDVTVANPAGAGTNVGFLFVRFDMGNNDIFWGARVSYYRT
jgi:hypothetical protein